MGGCNIGLLKTLGYKGLNKNDKHARTDLKNDTEFLINIKKYTNQNPSAEINNQFTLITNLHDKLELSKTERNFLLALRAFAKLTTRPERGNYLTICGTTKSISHLILKYGMSAGHADGVEGRISAHRSTFPYFHVVSVSQCWAS